MDKPRILLSGGKKPDNYIGAIQLAGGVPTAQYLPEVDTGYDGLILCGGGDIHPDYFGEPMDGSGNIDRPRDEREFALLRAYAAAGKPVLGICRGIQVVNVFFGGTIHQDLPNAADHSSFADHDLIHPVRAEAGSVWERLYGTRFVVNSHHHQALNRLGLGLRTTLVCEKDGHIEGVAHDSLPIFGVQWHPERMCGALRRADTVDGLAVFRYFMGLIRG